MVSHSKIQTVGESYCMKQGVIVLSLALLTIAVTSFGQDTSNAVVELKASDGTILKATYFASAKPGPGVLLLHQVNRDRTTWDGVAAQLAAAGINTLTLDMRGHGESGGKPFDK